MSQNYTNDGVKTLERASKALKKSNFACSMFGTGAEAVSYLLQMVGSARRIGLGGSMTIKALELAEKLRDAGNEIITHTPDMDRETKVRTWLRAQDSDFYFASPQAVTLKGELVMLDGNGNRVAACIYGPKKTVLVAGINKIVEDLERGLWRMRNVSAVANSARLKRNNPCVKTGKCEDCASPDRICNVLTVFYKKPSMTDIEVVLVNEKLGY